MSNDPIFENTKKILELEQKVLKLSNEKRQKQRSQVSIKNTFENSFKSHSDA